jgi:hypothetical protein
MPASASGAKTISRVEVTRRTRIAGKGFMGQCENCGATIQEGTVCPSCDRSFDDAVAEIGRKMRGVRLRGAVADRWLWRGAKTGLALGVGLSLVLVAIRVVVGLVKHRNLREMGETLGLLLLLFLVAAIFLSILFAAIFLVFGAVVKPIFVALFCSVERFEQEYEPPETK